MVAEVLHKGINDKIKDYESIKEALLKGKAKYQGILENLKSEFLFYAHDVNGIFTYVSPSVEKILGLTQQEYIKSYKHRWTSNLINKEAKKKANLTIQGIRQQPYVQEVFHQDGSCRQFVVTETPILNAQGETIMVEGISRDITAKIEVDEKLETVLQNLKDLSDQYTIELQNSQKQLLDIIDFLPDATYVVDVDNNIIAWNHAMVTMSGIVKNQAIGCPYHNIIKSFYQNDKPILIELMGTTPVKTDKEDQGISINNGIWSVERYLPDMNDGAGGHVWITAASIIDNENKYAGAVETIRDITQIKTVEKRIRENEQRLSTVMNNLPGMAYRIIKNDTWKLEFVSHGCRQLTGYDPSYFIDQKLSKFFQLIHEDDVQQVEKEFQSAMDTKRSFNAEYRITSATGETKWVSNRAEGATYDYEGSIKIEGFVADFTAYKNMEQQLRNENILLRSTIRDRFKFGKIIGNSQVMQDIYDLILKAATTEDSVFILGESGTGKELVSKAIHNASDRAKKNYVIVNCGAIPENLIESEFFGFKKGAFTGAISDKKGFLETADGGTLFLDEIGEISLSMQVKLLRAIEGGGFTPIGSNKLIRPNIRIIAASNKDPIDLVKNGKMRSDFFFRIHIIPIHLPPLRARGNDIFHLVDHFLKQYDKSQGNIKLSPEELKILEEYTWPGNVRELQNVIRRYLTLNNLDFLKKPNSSKKSPNILSSTLDEEPEERIMALSDAIAKFEKKYISDALKKNRWQKGKTATKLDISRKTLFRKMKVLEIV
jgi:PAS domain S-box-containing protein